MPKEIPPPIRDTKPRFRKSVGYPSKISEQDRKRIVKLRKRGFSSHLIAERFDVCHQRIHQILKEDAPKISGKIFNRIPFIICDNCKVTFKKRNQKITEDNRYCKECFKFCRFIDDKKHIYEGIKKVLLSKKRYHEPGYAKAGEKFWSGCAVPAQRAYNFMKYYEKQLKRKAESHV